MLKAKLDSNKSTVTTILKQLGVPLVQRKYIRKVILDKDISIQKKQVSVVVKLTANTSFTVYHTDNEWNMFHVNNNRQVRPIKDLGNALMLNLALVG